LLRGVGKIVPAAMIDAKEAAARILAEAESRARNLEATAAREREATRARAREEGLNEGRAAGFAEASLLLAEARARSRRLEENARDWAIPLARAMAGKIVGRALELDPSIMTEIVERALEASRAREGEVVLRVHPRDAAELESTRATWLKRLAHAIEVRVLADEAVARGGCVVETAVGRLDARLDSQLAAFEQALRGESDAPMRG